MFWILAFAMTALAVSFVLPPLLRPVASNTASTVPDAELSRKRKALDDALAAGVLDQAEHARKMAALSNAPAVRTSRTLPVMLLVLLPVSALALYLTLGDLRGLDPAHSSARSDGPRLSAPGIEATAAQTTEAANAPAMEQAIAGLAQRMRDAPDDLDGWMLLGRAYKSTEQFAAAREALGNAFRLAPEQPEVMIEYAEATALASETRRIGGESLMLIERALVLDPENQRGLWLRGIAAMQAGIPDEAVAIWEQKLLPLLSGDARSSLLRQIDSARADAGLPPRPAEQTSPAQALPTPALPASPHTATASTQPAASDDGQARIVVEVELAPELRDRVNASDVLFVYARAPEGPRMPLAIQRLAAGSLPTRVVLDDSTSMMPELKLSNMPQVVVGARISRSGLATPQAGDLEGLSSVISNRHAEPLRIRIDRLIEE